MITLVKQWAITPTEMQVSVPPRAGCVLSVVIPVRDEEESLPATLAALASQRDVVGSALDSDRFEIILLVNNSVDGSAMAARACARQHPALALHIVEVELPECEAHVGRARQLLMDTAAARLGPFGVIATTDADTVVAPDWIAMTLAEIEAGVDAVSGRILVDPTGFAQRDPHAYRFHLRDVTYRYLVTELEARLAPDPFDPWPRHFQHFGPSMAVTVETYRRAGGMPPLPSLEDVAFYGALRRISARIRHSPAVRVVTSARPTGRTSFGFAVQLGRWSQMGARSEPVMVESVPAIIARLGGQPDTGTPLAPIETAILELRGVLAGLRSSRPGAVNAFEQVQPVGLVAAAG